MSYETRLRRLEDRHIPPESIGKEMLVSFVDPNEGTVKIIKLRIGGGPQEEFDREPGESEEAFRRRAGDKLFVSA